MPKKRVYISSRINEMREFREAAVAAIEAAGMEPIYYDSNDPQKRWNLKPGVPIMKQLLDSTKSADIFLGLYGQTLKENWTPEGSTKCSMELEYEAAEAAGIPCLCYVTPPDVEVDEVMAKLRKKVMQIAVEFLSTPVALYIDLKAKLDQLKPRIFISYSSKDKEFVDQIYGQLKNSGYYSWKDSESIPKAELWKDALVKALSEADIMLLILSPDAVSSKWVKEEWKTFFETKKKIIPILYKECKVPREINKFQIIFTKGEGDGWYYDLLKSIEQNL